MRILMTADIAVAAAVTIQSTAAAAPPASGAAARSASPRNGSKVSRGSGGRDPRNVRRLSVRLKRGLRAGRYVARWSIVAADGHTPSGTLRFRLRK